MLFSLQQITGSHFLLATFQADSRATIEKAARQALIVDSVWGAGMVKDRLIGDLYESAIRQDDFLGVLQSATEAAGANMFHMFSWDEANNCPRFSVFSPGFNWEPIIDTYERYYAILDPRRDLVASAPEGTLVACQDYISDRDVARSEFYQDYQLPTAGLRYLMGARLTRPGSSETLLGLLRASGRSPFSDRDRETAASLIPHLHRAINLWQDAKVLHQDAALGNELMEQLGLAVFGLDKEGRVVYANQAGEALLRAGSSLKIKHGQLAAPNSADNDALRSAIIRVAKSRRGESLALQAPSGTHHELFLSIAKNPCQSPNPFNTSAILITVRRRADSPLLTANQLQRAFGLTPAEAAVAEALIEGTAPEDYADAKGISPNTVRTQVRAILSKTNARSQVKAVSTMVWLLSQRKAE